MSDLTERIRRVTEDLQAIQNELSAAARTDAPAKERDRIMSELASSNLVFEFKSAVDHMRHLLWSYIEASGRGEDVARTVQQVRMQRVTEMLRILAPTIDEKQMTQGPETDSFFEVITAIASTAVERHRVQPPQ